MGLKDIQTAQKGIFLVCQIAMLPLCNESAYIVLQASSSEIHVVDLWGVGSGKRMQPFALISSRV